MSDRRTFLRGLVSLPLIGGGITLIGKPTAAAVPVTDALHKRYLTWLAHEHLAAVKEHAFRSAVAHWQSNPQARFGTAENYGRRSMELADYLYWFPHEPDIETSVSMAQPSTRAAVVLSAAGVPLA